MFYNDLMANNYNDVYSLFSSGVQQQLEAGGGVVALQQQIQMYAQKYGNIKTYVIETQIAGPGTDQTVTVQVKRTKLQIRQSEKDTLILALEDSVWVIDKWNSLVTTNPT